MMVQISVGITASFFAESCEMTLTFQASWNIFTETFEKYLLLTVKPCAAESPIIIAIAQNNLVPLSHFPTWRYKWSRKGIAARMRENASHSHKITQQLGYLKLYPERFEQIHATWHVDFCPALFTAQPGVHVLLLRQSLFWHLVFNSQREFYESPFADPTFFMTLGSVQGTIWSV